MRITTRTDRAGAHSCDNSHVTIEAVSERCVQIVIDDLERPGRYAIVTMTATEALLLADRLTSAAGFGHEAQPEPPAADASDDDTITLERPTESQGVQSGPCACCEGRGYFRAHGEHGPEDVPCPTCGGVGSVVSPLPVGANQCKLCLGAGCSECANHDEWINADKCRACNGSGRVPIVEALGRGEYSLCRECFGLGRISRNATAGAPAPDVCKHGTYKPDCVLGCGSR